MIMGEPRTNPTTTALPGPGSPVEAEKVAPTPWGWFAEKQHRNPVLVEKVWKAAEAQGMSPMMAMALVDHESEFNPNAINVNKNRTQDYGLFQLNSYWHNQYRGDVDRHIEHGMKFIADNIRRYGTIRGLGFYNSGQAQDPETTAKRTQYVGRIMASYKNVERIMKDYQKVDPTFKGAVWSPQELKKMGRDQ